MPATPPVEAAQEALDEFLQYLLEQGFPCGVGERVKACEVYAAADPAVREKRLKTLLSPIFARSEADQQRFYHAYDLFFAPEATAEPPEVGVGQRPLPIPNSAIARWRKRQWVRLALVAAAIAGALGALAYFDVGARIDRLQHKDVIEAPPPPEKPVPKSGVSYRSVTEKSWAPFQRPCRGLECVVEGHRPWWILSPLLVFGVLYGISRTAASQRFAQLRREEQRGPPVHWAVLSHVPAFRFHGLLMQAAEAMRLRLSGDAESLDLPRTLDATIRGAGYPDFRYQVRKKTPEYVFLIEKRGVNDHFARWWADVGGLLQRQGISVGVYFYTSDIRRCYSAGSASPVSTLYLLSGFAQHFVVVVGSGRDLLHPFSGEFPSWLDAALVKRDQRALMTPGAMFEWGPADRKVAEKMPVAPARLANVPATVAGAELIRSRRHEAVELPGVPESYLEESEEDAAGGPPSLRMFLDDDVFQWLCACAIYPALEWELTLHLGLIVDPGGRIFEEKKMLQLIRLPWFRDGKIPGPWRAWLLKYLDREKQVAARELLIQSIGANRAPKKSFARERQDLQLAAQKYWLDPSNTERRTDLEAAFEAVPAVDVAEDFVLDGLRKSWNKAGVQEIAKAEWRHLRGPGRRIAAAALVCVAAVAAVVYQNPVWDKKEETQFDQALQARIQTDAPAKFPRTGWDKLALGKYYPGLDAKSSLMLVDTALGTVLGSVLKAHNLCINDQDLHSFFPPITTEMTPGDVIDRMLILSRKTFPCFSAQLQSFAAPGDFCPGGVMILLKGSLPNATDWDQIHTFFGERERDPNTGIAIQIGSAGTYNSHAIRTLVRKVRNLEVIKSDEVPYSVCFTTKDPLPPGSFNMSLRFGTGSPAVLRALGDIKGKNLDGTKSVLPPSEQQQSIPPAPPKKKS